MSAQRFNQGKTRFDLVPATSLEEVAKVFTYGSQKYGDLNWTKGLAWMSVIASCERHIHAFKMGEDIDSESGIKHLAHASANLMMLLAYYKIHPTGDNRLIYKPPKLRIGLDIDEVICNFIKGWTQKYEMDADVNNWSFDHKIRERVEEMKVDGTLDTFYLSLEPLIKGGDLPFEPSCYITARPVPSEVTMQWLVKYGFPLSPIFTVPMGGSKLEIARSQELDIFIDDNGNTVQQLNSAGICTFLFDQPHNRKFKVSDHKRVSWDKLKSMFG